MRSSTFDPSTGPTKSAEPRKRSKKAEAAVEGPKTLAPLPWESAALEPTISARTIKFHYGKHHQGYLDKLNTLIRGTGMADQSLAEIVTRTANDPERIDIYHNAAQVWNHDFFWRSLKPNGGGQPTGDLLQLAESSFGSIATMREKLAQTAIQQFGTGWAWLVQDGEGLGVVGTEDADNPLVLGMHPLLTIDVWEHAYYLDYQHKRSEYVHAVLERIINWDFAAENLRRPN